jgi:hypothetical protein
MEEAGRESGFLQNLWEPPAAGKTGLASFPLPRGRAWTGRGGQSALSARRVVIHRKHGFL